MPSVAQLAARMLCVGFEGLAPSPEVLELIDRGVAGVILFARNIDSPQQTADLCRQLKARAKGRPLLTCVDQEGGRVMRLRGPYSAVPPMRRLGQTRNPDLARRIGALLAREVRAAGFDLNFAPVLDVDTNPRNPVIGDRAFAADPQDVADMGIALIEGLQSARVAACAKHFPGHGDTHQDSHHQLPRLPHDMDRLRRIELAPFAAAIRAGVASIMTAHVIFEALDPAVPATMSKAVMHDLLRQTMGYDGLVISDDLEMKAIADHYGLDDAAVRGAIAGVDLFLVCHQPQRQHRVIDALIHAAESGTLPRTQLEAANQRLETLMRRYVQPADALADLSVIGCREHQAVIDEVMRHAGTASAAPMGPDPTDWRR